MFLDQQRSASILAESPSGREMKGAGHEALALYRNRPSSSVMVERTRAIWVQCLRCDFINSVLSPPSA